MARVPLLSERAGLSDAQVALFDWIVESRGSMIRPYEVLLHVPGIARPAAELGHQIRYEGRLTDHDRELSIITCAKVHRCQFEWDSHIALARGAGVREAAIAALQGAEEDLTEHEVMIIGFIRELCADSTVSDETYAAAAAALGASGVVELSTLVGYYTLLSFVMNVAGAGGAP